MAHQSTTSAFSRFLADLIQANPIQTFLVLVSIYIISVAATTWLMVRWLQLDTPAKAAPQKEHALQSGAKAETTSSTSRSKKE